MNLVGQLAVLAVPAVARSVGRIAILICTASSISSSIVSAANFGHVPHHFHKLHSVFLHFFLLINHALFERCNCGFQFIELFIFGCEGTFKVVAIFNNVGLLLRRHG